MSVSNGWTLPVITVNCGDAGSGAIQTIQAELDANNASDDALTSRVSTVETNLLQETKERKADVGPLTARLTYVETKNTSQDDSINNLSFQMQATQNSVSAISLTNTGASFGLPGTTASLVHATSANPSFKVKGLTASNSILFGVSMDTVDVSIDPVLIGRISTLENNNNSIQSSYILPCTINGSAHTVGFQRVGSIVCMMMTAKSTTGSSIVIIFSTALNQIYRLSPSGSQSMSTSIMVTDNGVSKASNVLYSDDQGRIAITTPNGFSGIGNLIMPVWSMTYSNTLVI